MSERPLCSCGMDKENFLDTYLCLRCDCKEIHDIARMMAEDTLNDKDKDPNKDPSN